MFANFRIRPSFRSAILFLIASALMPRAHGQIRVFAKVEPNANTVNNSAETYDPTAGTFARAAGTMATGRELQTATLLKNGQVLVAGGYNGTYLRSADLYDPNTGNFSPTNGLMTVARGGHTATLMQNGRVLLAGGTDGSTYINTAEIYDQSASTFTATSNVLTSGRRGHTATLLSDGKVLIAGGYNGSYIGSAELYDPVAGTFTGTSGTLVMSRAYHTAVLLPDGKVLIAGGQNEESYLDTAEVYDPATGKFTATANTMTAKRFAHAATLLSNGKVLIIGGYNGSYLNTADLYDPSSSRFAATSGAMTTPRQDHAAVSLPSGKVLICGGYNGNYLSSSELFDPSASTFAAQASPMTVARQLHSATLLPNGKVLIAGGQNSKLLRFDVNLDSTDNVSPNILFSADSKVGYVAYTGSGVILAFSTQTGEILRRVETGGKPAFATPLPDGKTLAYVSVFDNRIFLVSMENLQLLSTFTFSNAQFGFGSILTLSLDGSVGFVSSTGTGEVIKFSMRDGKESTRLGGIQAPTQLTLSKDGSILIVVDTLAAELVFVDASSMARKYTLKAKDKVATAALSIFNKPVLAADGNTGIIACRNLGGSLSSGTALIFKTSTGEVLDTETLGSDPGFTGLTPNGLNWVVLNSSDLSLIPTYDPKAMQSIAFQEGDPIGSATVAFSPDSRYAYYPSSANDTVYQLDTSTLGFVGKTLVGDDPNKTREQPAGMTVTPDGNTLAVIEFMSNNIDLVSAAYTLEGAKFIISGNQFTGLSLVNLADQATKLKVTVLDNYGQAMAQDGLTNPVELALGPNAQIAKNVSEIFNFDLTKDHVGRISVEADQPLVAGYISVGKITATWFGYYLNQMDGAPLFRDRITDWVVPDIPAGGQETLLMDFTSTNYSQQNYDVKHFSEDGTLREEKLGNLAYPTNRLEQNFTDLFTTQAQNKVVIIGGQASSATSSSADAYDVSAKTFAATGTMTTPRTGHTSTLLLNGKVLVAGGKNGSTVLNTAETYDIAAGTFTATPGPLANERHRHTATLLPSGRVLIAGGQSSVSVNNTAEIYDPTANTFTSATGNMTVPRDSHTATLLPNGKVLIAGGINGNTVSNTAELFDPATGQFTSAGNMTAARVFHTATFLQSGRVLIAGGFDGSYLSSAEIYDPVGGTFKATATPMASRRNNHTATLLSDGRVLIAGGSDSNGPLGSAEIYDPSSNSFTAITSAMTSVRSSHAASLISGGKVLISGGSNSSGPLNNAEIYNPDTQTFEATAGTMGAARSGHTSIYLQSAGEGHLRVTCKRGLIFTEYFGTSKDSSMLNGIDVPKYVGIKKLYSPHFAITSGFISRLNLINANQDADAVVTITLHGPDGRIIGTPATQSIARNGKLQNDLNSIFLLDPAVQNTTGWLEIASTADRMVGTITFTNDETGFLTSFELSGTPLTRFVYPLAAEDIMYQTGIALLNTNSEAANLILELWGPGGTLLRSANFALPSGSRTALYLSDYFPKLEPILVGNIRIRSDKPVHSFSLINDRSFHFLAAVPPIPFP